MTGGPRRRVRAAAVVVAVAVLVGFASGGVARAAEVDPGLHVIQIGGERHNKKMKGTLQVTVSPAPVAERSDGGHGRGLGLYRLCQGVRYLAPRDRHLQEVNSSWAI